MTRSDDELLRDALREDAGGALPPADGFDAVRATAESRARRRRWQVGLVAGSAAAAIALVVGVVVANDDDRSSVELTPPPSSSSSTSTSSSTTTAPTTTTSTTSTTAPTPTTPPITTGTLPPPAGFAGFTDFRTVPVGSLDAMFTEPAASPPAKVDALAAALAAEPIEGRRTAEGVVNSVQGNRAQIEVRVIGYADDSIGGRDYRLYLLQEQPGGPWIVVGAEERDLCSRGFDGTFCV
jgi:hypothetical protein